MTDLSRRKHVRGGHRASTTIMIKKAEELLSVDTVSASQLARVKLGLQQKINTLKQLDAEVVELVKDEDVVEEIQRADAYMEGIYDVMARLE